MNCEVRKRRKLDRQHAQYLGDIRSEMKRVTWPSRKRWSPPLVVVIVSVFAFAALLSTSSIESSRITVQALDSDSTG
jgi:preprotein translocase SecE subunit